VIKKNKKLIKFSIDKAVEEVNIPMPSKTYLPEWFKKAPKFYETDKIVSQQVKTFKNCNPLTDTFISGYIFELWSDIEVVINEEGYRYITWKNDDYSVIKTRDQRGSMDMPKVPGFSEEHYTLSHPLYIQTPPGYSCLIMQPLNRHDLNTMVPAGIVDSDKDPFFPGNYPIMIKEDFEGVIEVGTPLFQIIPFKRDNWISERDDSIRARGDAASRKSSRKIVGWYRDNVWSKKSYE
jgi:hypothetical protein